MFSQIVAFQNWAEGEVNVGFCFLLDKIHHLSFPFIEVGYSQEEDKKQKTSQDNSKMIELAL